MLRSMPPNDRPTSASPNRLDDADLAERVLRAGLRSLLTSPPSLLREQLRSVFVDDTDVADATDWLRREGPALTRWR